MNRRPQLDADDLKRLADSTDPDVAALLAELHDARRSLRRMHAEQGAILGDLQAAREDVRDLSEVWDRVLDRHEFDPTNNKPPLCYSCPTDRRMPSEDVVHETASVYLAKLRAGETPISETHQR